MIRVHTNHTNKTDSFSKFTEKEMILSDRDKDKAYMLMSLITQKVKYKQKDLFRDRQKYMYQELFEEMIENNVDYEENNAYFTGEWAYAFENVDLIEALESLSYRQQEILWLLFVEMKSQVEVAQKFQVSPAYISKTKKICYSHIYSFLEKNRGD